MRNRWRLPGPRRLARRPEIGALSLIAALAGLIVVLVAAGIVAAFLSGGADDIAAPKPIATTVPSGTGAPGSSPSTTIAPTPGPSGTTPAAGPGAAGASASTTTLLGSATTQQAAGGTSPGSGLGAEGPGEIAGGRRTMPDTGGDWLLVPGSGLLAAGIAAGRLRRRLGSTPRRR